MLTGASRAGAGSCCCAGTCWHVRNCGAWRAVCARGRYCGQAALGRYCGEASLEESDGPLLWTAHGGEPNSCFDWCLPLPLSFRPLLRTGGLVLIISILRTARPLTVLAFCPCACLFHPSLLRRSVAVGTRDCVSMFRSEWRTSDGPRLRTSGCS